MACSGPALPACARNFAQRHSPVLENYEGRPFAKWWAEEVDAEDSVSYAPTQEKMRKKEVEVLLARPLNLSNATTPREVRRFTKEREEYEYVFLDAHAWTSRFDLMRKVVLQHEMTKHFLENSVSEA